MRGLARELANNPQQQKNSAYARGFQLPGAHLILSAKTLSRWVKDPQARARYVEAFKRSNFEAMLNYYKANYPRLPYKEDKSPIVPVKMPVLMFHGLADTALLPGALNDTWKWLEKDLTLVTIPGAGNNGAGLPAVTCVVVAFTSACGVSGVLVCGSREFFFPHPTTNKPIKIGISTFIAERILPHHPDSEKFRGSSIQSHCSLQFP
jgi:hypothetical protein